MTEVRLPKLGLTMEEARILRWRKSPGEVVARGEVLVEIETDKAAMEVEAPEDGVLLAQRVREGETVPMGAVIAVLGQPGEEAPAEPEPPLASPAVRRRAQEREVDLAGLRGSGPGGRITLADVEGAAASGMRQAIARRTEASAGIPQFPVLRRVRGEGIERLRRLVGPEVERKIGVRPTVTDFLLLASARALMRHPEFCVRWEDGRIQRVGGVRIGLVVAVEGGLVVPTLSDLAERPLAEVARQRARAVEQARQGHLAADLVGPAVFTLSNLGPLGVEAFVAFLNPGETAALAAGRLAPAPAVEDGQLVVRTQMTLVLSVDHRVVDGVAAARFLTTLGDFLESEDWPLF